MATKPLVMGLIDEYVVTGFGKSGCIPDKSKVPVNADGKIITIDIQETVRRANPDSPTGYLEFGILLRLLPFYRPTWSEAAIKRQLALLESCGFALDTVCRVVEHCNHDLLWLVQTHVKEPLVFVLDLPICDAYEGIRIGDPRPIGAIV